MSRLQKSFVIFAVSVISHLYGIASPGLDYHYHRQVNTAAIAYNYHVDGLPFFHPRITWDGNNNGVAATELPVYMWLVGLFWGVFNLGEIWGRLLSVFFSGLTAVVLYRFLTHWIEEGAAFWGSILFSMLPIEVYFGRTIQPESLALLCYAASLWAFDRYLQDKPHKNPWGIFAAICASVSIGLKLPYAHLWLILVFLILSRKGWGAIWNVRIWLLFLLSALPVAGWYHYTSAATHSAPGQGVLPTSFSAMSGILDYNRNLRVLPYYFFYQMFSRFPELTTTYAGLAFFGMGAWTLYRRKRWFPFLWWLSVVLYAIAGGGYTFHHEYTALPFALVNAAFLGAGFWEMRRQALTLPRTKRKAAIAGLAALVVAMPVHAALRIAVGPKSGHWYRINYPFLLTLKPTVDRLSSSEDLFFCNNRAPSVYLFYIARKGWAWDLEEAGEKNLYLFDELTRSGVKFFLTEKNQTFSSKNNPIARHFFDRFPVAYQDNDVIIFKIHPLPETKT